jgi:F-type H+-transporting ATPase subunit delta
MRQPKVAQRYAKALFDLALETNQLEEVKLDIDAIRSLKNQEMETVFMSPVIQDDKKVKIFNAIFEGKVTKLTSSFFSLVFRKGRMINITEILVSFDAQYRVHHRIVIVDITTAVPVDDEVLTYIQSKMQVLPRFKDSKLEMRAKVDEVIIGGFVLQAEDILYDASIRHDLFVIRKQFIENMYVQKLR